VHAVAVGIAEPGSGTRRPWRRRFRTRMI
jgi:hypothetical protein